jgi:RNA polymerase sigma-70 factor, ECF subfamily
MKIPKDNILAGIMTHGRSTVSESTASFNMESSIHESSSTTQTASRDQAEAEVTVLLRKHAASLSRYAYAIAWNTAIVPDGIQEAFLRYFSARVNGQKIENQRAWLFRVLRNYIHDCNRRSALLSEVDLNAASHVLDDRHDAESALQNNEAFKRALSLLSPRERECVRLRLEGFDYEEIAHILKIRTGTVGSLIARSMKKIRNTGLFSGRKR